MYRKILCALDHTAADQTLLPHVVKLAGPMKSELLLVHVADGWAARNFDELKLRESEEMQSDRRYLDQLHDDLEGRGFKVETRLAMGDPATELIKATEEQGVDLIAMSTHGHRFVKDILLGATADRVRHLVKVPVLLLRAQ